MSFVLVQILEIINDHHSKNNNVDDILRLLNIMFCMELYNDIFIILVLQSSPQRHTIPLDEM